MKYRYKGFELSKDNFIWRPIIPVVLLSESKFVAYEILLDSGADYNVFSSSVADFLEISMSRGKTKKIYGLGNQMVKGYEHEIEIKLAGKRFEINAIFCKDMPEHSFGVLGNQGFFDKFKVTFDYRKKIIEIA